MPDFEAANIALAVIGTVSVGTIVLLQVQALKQLLGDWLEGRNAIIAVFLCSLVAQLIAFQALGVDWRDDATYPSLYIATLGTFVSAAAQYSFLFKVSVSGLPPGPDASVPVSAVRDASDPYDS
ncbi:MAG: hypothetical protein M3440_04720, partial [Chloroflexota bacterium]|nr:hypothetical protein [Chloroflexota bacterium]